jgi:hypothetical protein
MCLVLPDGQAVLRRSALRPRDDPEARNARDAMGARACRNAPA